MPQSIPAPYYYLDNFRFLLGWIAERYADLLLPDEAAFLQQFPTLPHASQALLVRMVMRRGELFRASKLNYAEIGATAAAVQALLTAGWVTQDPQLGAQQAGQMLIRAEVMAAMAHLKPATRLSKDELLQHWAAHQPQTQAFSAWHAGDALYQLQIRPWCDRMRLMFFGNLRQDWSEFVLSELGVYRYEKVEIAAEARVFRCREDVDMYLHLHACRTQLEDGSAAASIASQLGTTPLQNPWLEERRGRLLFALGQQFERQQDWAAAAQMYEQSTEPAARVRAVRVLERSGQHAAALVAAQMLTANGCDEVSLQQLQRMLPRLQRASGAPVIRKARKAALAQLDLVLPQPPAPLTVEHAVVAHLHAEDAPTFYVENTLINALFGLLCWDALFAPLPGAFFHPFQFAPADLASPHFHRRRKDLFEVALAELESGSYADTIRQRHAQKYGTQSSFVAWSVITPELLHIALSCLPATHLRLWFTRMLCDITTNRSGLPDLIQFWPAEQRYRMVEVKGPGDRLQDNQTRWLHYCVEHGIPVAVCYVTWA